MEIKIYSYKKKLKEKLKREPTDDEIEQFINKEKNKFIQDLMI